VFLCNVIVPQIHFHVAIYIFELNLFFFLVFLVFKLRVYILYGFVVG
jgi:hypothetical protein